MVRRIGLEEAKALVEQGIDVVDVREPGEFATGHVPGARLVPLGQLRADPGAAKLHDKMLFVCAKGGRSLSAAEVAVARGFGEIYNLSGGMSAWTGAGLPVDHPAKSSAASASAPAPVASATSDGGGDSIPPAADTGSGDPELDEVVASNLKQLRSDRGWTLDVLAGMSGVARQTLGQIELGRTVPSLGTLWKIARAFEVPFSTLLGRAERLETQIFRHATAKRLVSSDGRFSSRALFAAEETGNGKVEFYELWLAGHGRDDAEAHAPGTRENLVVTAGRLVLEIGGERHELVKGDAIAFTADVPHAYVNPGSEECWMNLVMTYR